MGEPIPGLPQKYIIPYNPAFAGILRTVNILSRDTGQIQADGLKTVIALPFNDPANDEIETVMQSGPTDILVPGLPTWFAGGFMQYDFTGANYNASGLTVTRNSTATDLLPSSPSGASYNTFAVNTPRITPGVGLLIEETRVNQLKNSTAPATQTTASLGTGTYTLWVNGSGTATPSAGTATITGATAATQGSPGGFVVTVAGTVTVTVSGSLNAFQLELSGVANAGTSLIITGGSSGSRASDTVSDTSIATPTGAQTMYASGIPFMPIAYGTSQSVFAVSDGTSSNRILCFRGSSTGLLASLSAVSSVTLDQIVGGVGAAGVQHKWAYSHINGLAAGAYDGVAPATAAPNGGPPTTINLFYLGNNGGGAGYFDGYIQRIAWWPNQALSVAQLTAMTANPTVGT